MVRRIIAAWSMFGLGACFTGGFLSGQPCQSDAECGPSLACEAGVCGGTTSLDPSTSVPTSDATTTLLPTSTGSDSTTTTTATTTTGTSTGDPTTGPVTTDDSTTGETCGLGRCKDIDLVVIVDNSESMNGSEDTLLAALLSFQKYLVPEITQACSVHLGVTTTDEAYGFNPPECQTLGALVTKDYDGNECMTAMGAPYATLEDLDNLAPLLCLIRVGSVGSSNEKPIEAMFSLFDADVNKPDGCNAGFIRKGAQLVVVMATDEDDDDNDAQGHNGSNIGINLWHDSLTVLKPEQDLLMVGLLGDDDQAASMCMWDPFGGADGSGAEASPNLQSFFASFPADHATVGSLCQPSDPLVYDPLMMQIQAQLRSMCEV